MNSVTEVRVLPDYRVYLRFDDVADGEVDLSDLVGRGVFAACSAPERFSQASVDQETGTVAWPVAIGLCRDRLYHGITGGFFPGA